MPIFRTTNKDILFIHIPKAGGTSVEKFFYANRFSILFIDNAGKKTQYLNSLNNLTKCSPQHMHGDLLKSYFDLLCLAKKVIKTNYANSIFVKKHGDGREAWNNDAFKCSKR